MWRVGEKAGIERVNKDLHPTCAFCKKQCLFRQNTYRYLRNNKHVSPAKVGTGCLELKLPAGS